LGTALRGVFGPCLFLGPREILRPRQDSNLRHRLRRPVLYPLSYEGECGDTQAMKGLPDMARPLAL
jgi:hypothetical protein